MGYYQESDKVFQPLFGASPKSSKTSEKDSSVPEEKSTSKHQLKPKSATKVDSNGVDKEDLLVLAEKLDAITSRLSSPQLAGIEINKKNLFFILLIVALIVGFVIFYFNGQNKKTKSKISKLSDDFGKFKQHYRRGLRRRKVR